MNDFIEEYRERVRTSLSRVEDEPVSRVAEALTFPSFHAETLLRVTEDSGGTTFRLFTFSSSLWYSVGGETPRRFEEIAEVPADVAARFWETMTRLDPASIRSTGVSGTDGMLIFATYRDRAAESRFETWSPDPETRDGEYLGLIYDLAWQVVQSDLGVERLEHLHGYIRRDLPARVIESEIKCLRIFGALSSSKEPALRETFELFSPWEPLIVDMTNFDGMGTFLYPTFVEFAVGHSNLAWVVSQSARMHIESMGMNEPALFDSVAEAREWFRRRGHD